MTEPARDLMAALEASLARAKAEQKARRANDDGQSPEPPQPPDDIIGPG
jgi:hypothetical protein